MRNARFALGLAALPLIGACSLNHPVKPIVADASTPYSITDKASGARHVEGVDMALSNPTPEQAKNWPAARIEPRIAKVSYSKDKVIQQVKGLFHASSIESIEVTQRDFHWALEHMKFSYAEFLPDSPVWAVTVKGELYWPMAAAVAADGKIKAPTKNLAELAISVEDGAILSVAM